MLARPLLNKMPRIRPRKNASSIRGTAIAAPRIFVRENQLMAKRSEKMWSASKSAPQQRDGCNQKRAMKKSFEIKLGEKRKQTVCGQRLSGPKQDGRKQRAE